MAIQQINLGSAPAGTGGDTQRAANTKINQNFSNRTHAASRLVGDNNGNVAEVKATGYVSSGFGGVSQPDDLDLGGVEQVDKDRARLEQLYLSGKSQIWSSSKAYFNANYDPNLFIRSGTTCANIQIQRTTGNIHVSYGFGGATFQYRGTAKVYTDKNTILDGGYLKPSSPVLRLGRDDFTKEHEAEYLDIKVDNPEKGVYKITGTTGLRNDGTWYFSPPKDEHLNVLCMVEIEEEGEVITVKTYAKKFDFNTVSIVPDYDNPVDIIGEVLLRFNDLPEEDMQGEVANEPIE